MKQGKKVLFFICFSIFKVTSVYAYTEIFFMPGDLIYDSTIESSGNMIILKAWASFNRYTTDLRIPTDNTAPKKPGIYSIEKTKDGYLIKGKANVERNYNDNYIVFLFSVGDSVIIKDDETTIDTKSFNAGIYQVENKELIKASTLDSALANYKLFGLSGIIKYIVFFLLLISTIICIFVLIHFRVTRKAD